MVRFTEPLLLKKPQQHVSPGYLDSGQQIQCSWGTELAGIHTSRL